MENKSYSTKFKAQLALLGGGIFFGISSPLARAMGKWLQPFSVVFIRFLFALPFALIFFLKGERPKNVPYKKLTGFALLFPISVCLYTFSLFYTKVSIAIFSFYIANVVASIVIGIIFNKEKLTGKKLVGFIIALIAVVILTNPFEGFTMSLGMILGYLSGIFQSIASLYQKRLSQYVNEKTLTITQVIGGLFVGLVSILFIHDKSIFAITPHGLLLGLLFGFLFFLINYLMIYGFKHADIGVGTILLSSELIFGPIAAFLIFRETLSGLEILGGILIAISVTLVSMHREKPSVIET